MNELAGYPYLEVQITGEGELYDAADLGRVKTHVDDHEISDLIVVSHGWNNHMAEARQLYEELLGSARAVAAGGSVPLADRKIGVVGILWPSKKFADKELIPAGGAASAGGAQPQAEVEDRLAAFAEALDDPAVAPEIEELRRAVGRLEDSADARRLFADKVRVLLPGAHADADDGSAAFFAAPAEELFRRLEAPFLPQRPGPVGGGAGGAAGGVMGGATGGALGGVMGAGVTPGAGGPGGPGGAAGLGDWFSGMNAAARRILNYGTYYVMKARAGRVGAGGVRKIVAAVRGHRSRTRVHLVGHSFGGRVVTAAAKALGDAGEPQPASMSLLQAAFSHNGFARRFDGDKDGHFRSVMRDRAVAGPVLVTHTHNDTANGLAYPLASRFSGADAAAVGGPDDRFGAIGANGAQHTPEARPGTLLAAGSPGYHFEAGRLYNLQADAYIEDHGDVTGPEVAYGILTAIAST